MNVETMSNAELDRLAIKKDRLGSKVYNYTTLREIDYDQYHKAWIIKGILAFGETSAWIAPPGGMKSALMAELSFAVATGNDWHGRPNRNEHCRAVVYFALERCDLVKRRLFAHWQRMGMPEGQEPPIAVIQDMIDLANPSVVEKVLATVATIEEELGSIGLIIFDTFAKLIAAGGGDENQAKDQGRVFANVQRIKNLLVTPHIAIVGHTGKDETRGARGSNAILGDVDVMVSISGDTIKTATVTKANDMPEGALFSFNSEVHELEKDEDGEPITVNIVSAEEPEAAPPSNREPKLSANQRAFFTVLHEAGSAGLTVDDWNAQARANGIGTSRKSDLYEWRIALKSKGLVRQYGERWKVVHP